MRLSVLGGGWRRQGASKLRSLGTILLVALLLAAVVAGVLLLADSGPAVAAPFLIVFGAGLTVLLVLWPIAGGGDSLDPRAFAAYGLSRPRLLLGLFLGGLIGLPALILLTAGIAGAVRGEGGAGVVAFAILGVLVTILFVVIASRIVALLAGVYASGARARAVGRTILGILLVVGAVIGALLITTNWRWGTGFQEFQAWGTALGWTPFGAAWSAPALAAQGQWEGAWGQLGLLALVTTVVAGAWVLLVVWTLNRPLRVAPAPRSRGLGWYGVLPGTPAGAVAARSMTYWSRDARYRVAFSAVPVIALLVIAPFAVAGMPLAWLALIPVPVFAWMLGWLPHNDLSNDHTAFWLHVSTGVSGLADRIGRIVPGVLYGVPVIVAGSALAGYLNGEPWAGLAVFGISLGLLLAGLGASSVLSVKGLYPSVQPAQDPFRQPQLLGGAAVRSQFLGLLLPALFVSPGIAFLLLGLEGVGAGGQGWLFAAAGAGAGLGLLVLLGGVLLGARIYDGRGPELLTAVQRG